MKATWDEGTDCIDHGAAACDCSHKVRIWRLFVGGPNIAGTVCQFYPDAPFYGTWEVGDGGRTGAMATLENAKRAVEDRVRHSERPH